MDNAIKFIKLLVVQRQAENIENAPPVVIPDQQQPSDVMKQCKILKKQNKRFRDLFKNEFAPNGMTDKDFCQLDFCQLNELIKQKKVEQHTIISKDKIIIDAVNDAGDVFVVENNRSTANQISSNLNSDDHTYSLIQEAEVEIGLDSNEHDQEVMIIEGQLVDEAMEAEPQRGQATTTLVQKANFSTQPIIIQMATPLQLQSGLRSSILPPAPPNKLPLPRHYSTSTCTGGLVNVYNTPVVASQPWRVPKEKRKRKRAKKDTTTTAGATKESNGKAKESTTDVSAGASSVVTSLSVNTSLVESDFVRVSASESVPRAILASQEEIVDLTVDSKDDHEADKKDKSKTGSKKANEAAADQEKTVLATLAVGDRRKARSSYSIAALCQMSVNIGGDPAAGVPEALHHPGAVNSPGVISLNSTESPRATPTPQSPMPVLKSQQQLPAPPVVQASAGVPKIQKLQQHINPTGKKVIQELKPINEKQANSSSSSRQQQFISAGQETISQDKEVGKLNEQRPPPPVVQLDKVSDTMF